MSNELSQPEKPQTSKVVRISSIVLDHLKEQAHKGEIPDDVLRRLFSLPPNQERRANWRQ